MKFKVLCLHGYTQSAQKFRDRTGPFRRALKATITTTFLDAPHQATHIFTPTNETVNPTNNASNDGAKNNEEESSLAWWNQSEDSDRVWQEIRASIRAVAQVIRDEGPFDGIVGFSQGAGMAAILCALAQLASVAKNSSNPGLALEKMSEDVRAAVADLGLSQGFGFGLFFAGFYPGMPQFAEIMQRAGKLELRSMHVMGEADAIVSPERGAELAHKAFCRAVTAYHPGGHFMPSNAEWRKQYQEFFLTLTQKQQE
ncbi:Ovarian cancer-associated protein 2 [Kickxella alabastrina]|uniref:Ovarian cancer-associated protein 2 n=1 Tax=Kickxella alabastrina TaxID=61397 RepID=A0ACC1IDB3_9FUNG|nr:Ovarian cancer-associated protein 2 [Kickxella alabastrina]